eukprot:COSAG05_NODE_9729_length_605_cov_1.551383_1_plen_201_part_11
MTKKWQQIKKIGLCDYLRTEWMWLRGCWLALARGREKKARRQGVGGEGGGGAGGMQGKDGCSMLRREPEHTETRTSQYYPLGHGGHELLRSSGSRWRRGVQHARRIASLGPRSEEDRCLGCETINPADSSLARLGWDALVVVTLAAVTLATPVYLVFGHHITAAGRAREQWVGRVIDVLWVVDIAIRFRTAYRDGKGELIF